METEHLGEHVCTVSMCAVNICVCRPALCLAGSWTCVNQTHRMGSLPHLKNQRLGLMMSNTALRII